VIDELIKLSKEIVASDLEAKELGLTDFEYAFYTAVAIKESARAKFKRTLRKHSYHPICKN
jgi:type I restriction enzyme, R subunit